MKQNQYIKNPLNKNSKMYMKNYQTKNNSKDDLHIFVFANEK